MNASCHLPSLIAEATKKLRDRCGDRAVFEARLLLGIATGSDEAIYSHMSVQLTDQQIVQYETLIAQKVVQEIYDGVKTSELDDLSAQNAMSLYSTHPDFKILAYAFALLEPPISGEAITKLLRFKLFISLIKSSEAYK